MLLKKKKTSQIFILPLLIMLLRFCDDVSRIKVLLEYFGYQISENESFQDVSVLEEIMELQNKSMSVESESEKNKIKSQLMDKIEKEIKRFLNCLMKKNIKMFINHV